MKNISPEALLDVYCSAFGGHEFKAMKNIILPDAYCFASGGHEFRAMKTAFVVGEKRC